MPTPDDPPASSPAQPARDPADLTLSVDGLRYTLDRPPSPSGGKAVVAVSLDDAGETRDTPHRDRVDLYAWAARLRFAGQVADLFARQRRDVLAHLALLLDQVERARAAPVQTLDPTQDLDEARRARADELLRDPRLLDRAADTLTALGYVGEEETKRLCYLVATSRLLPRPLSAILLAPSGSGKSELLDTVLRLLPPEAVRDLSRITPAALYYAGADSLAHKLVLVDEQAGSAEADHSVRTLQTKGLLRLAVPHKGRTEDFVARGPIALMSGTTSSALNPENLSRCLQLPLDDSPEQTRRIQAAQRQAASGAAPQAPAVEPWQDAQRLLEPLEVLIPYAEQLAFPARTTHDRRGNQKLLDLVLAHALLHQRQRERDAQGRVLAAPADYAQVHALLAASAAHDPPDLSPRAARAYRLLAGEARPLTRREVAELLGWAYSTARRALDELLALELATLADRGPPARHRLLDASVLGQAGELLDPGRLED